MPLGDALDFLFGTVGLQATIADDVKTRNAQVTMSVQAGAMAIIDSLLEQQELAIVYDPAIEVAQIYTQERVDERLAGIRTSIENYNSVLRERKRLAEAKRDRERVMEILGYVQLLLSGDDEGFIIGIESVSRAPGYTVTNDLITSIRVALDLRNDMARFDRQTGVMMEGRSELAQPPACSTWPDAPTSRTSQGRPIGCRSSSPRRSPSTMPWSSRATTATASPARSTASSHRPGLRTGGPRRPKARQGDGAGHRKAPRHRPHP